MISRTTDKEAFVWVWLPDRTEPVVAGKLSAENGTLVFNYGKRYLARAGAISLYDAELPLRPGVLPLPNGLTMPGCIRDASPDAWGRRVLMNRITGQTGRGADTAQLDELTYLLESGSDRIGALDFQRSPEQYVPRMAANASLAELQEAAERIEQGLPLNPALAEALQHGTSIGGARPKALIDDGNRKHIAKFSSSSDLYNVVKAEYVAMRLAALAGLEVAAVSLVRAAGKDVLLIERFDRQRVTNGWRRKPMVSALTLLGLDELMARYASYETLAEIIRHKFTQAPETLKELFSRLTFNILCGNTDDHARNHAAFWDGTLLSLTPAYDICPQGRTGNEASQAMLISGNNRMSRIASAVEAAHHLHLSRQQARAIAAHQIHCIETHWDAVCDEAELNAADRTFLWRRQFLNPYALEGMED